MRKKKKMLVISVCAAAVVLILCAVLFSGGERDLFAVTAAPAGQAGEKTYRAYLESKGYDGRMAGSEAAVDVFAWQADGAAENGREGVLTEDTGHV